MAAPHPSHTAVFGSGDDAVGALVAEDLLAATAPSLAIGQVEGVIDTSAGLLPLEQPVVVLALALASFLVAPILIERAGLPGIVGVVLAGTLLGPNGTGILAHSDAIFLLGNAGLVYLLFTEDSRRKPRPLGAWREQSSRCNRKAPLFEDEE